jgi:hypothetical protein
MGLATIHRGAFPAVITVLHCCLTVAPDTLRAQLDAMRVVNQAVQDRISDPTTAEVLVPVTDWELGAH